MTPDREARQHVQLGLARRRSRQHYLHHRSQIKRRARTRYRRVRHSGVFHRKQRHRLLHPDQHRRIHGSVPIPFWSRALGWGEVVEVIGPAIHVSIDRGVFRVPYWLFLSDSVFGSEDGMEMFFSLLDKEMGFDGSFSIPDDPMMPSTRQARDHHPGEVWKTQEGKWRSQNPSGDAKSFDNKEQAEAHAKPKKDEGGHEEGGGEKKGLKSMISSFFSKAKDLAPAAKAALKQAPKEAQRLIVDKDHRKEATSKAVEAMKKGAKAIPGILKHATTEELKEIKDGVLAVKKKFKKPPEEFTKHDKKALYAVGVYVVAGTVMAATGGLGAMAGTLGHSFAKHVAFKAISHIMDRGFTHYEVGHSFLHGLHHFTDHLASERVAARYLFSKEDATDEELQETLVTYIYQAIHDVLEEGLTDEDMVKVLEAVNEKTDKEASFKSKVNVVKVSNEITSLVCSVLYQRANRSSDLEWDSRKPGRFEDRSKAISIPVPKSVSDALEATGTTDLSIQTTHTDKSGPFDHHGNNYFGILSLEVFLPPRRSDGQVELASLLAHELTHSIQMLKQDSSIPSYNDLKSYALDPHEIPAHIREFVRRSKMTGVPLYDVMTTHWTEFFEQSNSDKRDLEFVLQEYTRRMGLHPSRP